MILFYRQHNIYVKRAMVTLMVLPLITGCIPVLGYYFEPDGVGITAKGSGCKGKVGFPEYAYTSLGGIELEIMTSREAPDTSVKDATSESSLFVKILFSSKPGPTITLDPTSTLMADINNNTQAVLQNIYVNTIESYPYRSTFEKLMNTDSFTHLESEAYTTLLYLEFTVGKDAKEFYLQLPKIMVAGVGYSPPKIHLKEKSGIHILPFNC